MVPSTTIPEAVRALAARATRVETPCGSGTIAWHLWGSGPPVVLLHGGSGSWTHWLRNIDALTASGRQVVVPDLPGFGDSAVLPHGGDADAIFEPLEAGLREVLGGAACTVVGFSFGSMVAGFLARRFPERVARLVAVGAPGMGMWAGRNALELAPWRHLNDAAARREVHRGNLAILMLHHPAAIDGDAIALQQWNVERDRTRGRSLARTDALIRALREVSCPVFAIYGEHDALYQDRLDEVQALLEATPTFRRFTRIAGAGHWVQYERAEAFNAALLEALAA